MTIGMPGQWPDIRTVIYNSSRTSGVEGNKDSNRTSGDEGNNDSSEGNKDSSRTSGDKGNKDSQYLIG